MWRVNGTGGISFHCFSRRRCGGGRGGGEEMVSDAKRLKKLWIGDLIWTDTLYCLICSFVLPACRKKLSPLVFSLPLSHTPTAPSPPIPTFSHGVERFLSSPGRIDIAARKRHSSEGGARETAPEAGRKPPANTSALLKPDSSVNQRPECVLKPGLRQYDWSKIKIEWGSCQFVCLLLL